MFGLIAAVSLYTGLVFAEPAYAAYAWDGGVFHCPLDIEFVINTMALMMAEDTGGGIFCMSIRREVAVPKIRHTKREIRRFLAPENTELHTVFVVGVVMLIFLILISWPSKRVRGQ